MRVVTTCTLSTASLDRLRAAGCTLERLPADTPIAVAAADGMLADAEALICTLTDRIDASVLDAAPALSVVASVSVGHEHIDTDDAARRGVLVRTTPGVLDAATADVTILLMLAACRRSTEAEADLRRGAWRGWALDQYIGLDLPGRTLGVVGWGRIGRAVAERARVFGLEVLHHARRPSGDAGYVADLDELIAASDIVTLHVPLTADSRHLLDARRIALLRPAGVVVNTSRGAVIDEAALAEALHARRIFGAGLDVYESEPTVHPRLLSAPGTTLFPHIGSAADRTRDAMASMAVDAVIEAVERGRGSARSE